MYGRELRQKMELLGWSKRDAAFKSGISAARVHQLLELKDRPKAAHELLEDALRDGMIKMMVKRESAGVRVCCSCGGNCTGDD